MDYKSTLIETLEVRFDMNDEDTRGEVLDIVEHGIMSGFHDFTYTHELVALYDEFEEEILDLIIGFGLTPNDLVVDTNSWHMDEMKQRAVWIVVESYCGALTDELVEEELLV